MSERSTSELRPAPKMFIILSLILMLLLNVQNLSMEVQNHMTHLEPIRAKAESLKSDCTEEGAAELDHKLDGKRTLCVRASVCMCLCVCVSVCVH